MFRAFHKSHFLMDEAQIAFFKKHNSFHSVCSLKKLHTVKKNSIVQVPIGLFALGLGHRRRHIGKNRTPCSFTPPTPEPYPPERLS
jgi:hypothetical protein